MRQCLIIQAVLYVKHQVGDFMTTFQHSDEWRRDQQQQLNELRTMIDMIMTRIATLESQNNAISHKLHSLKYAGVDE